MAIPRFASYEMPRPETFPTSKVSWPFDPQRAVLLVHDMQRYFLDFYGDHSPLVAQLVESVVSLKRYARAHGMKVVYTAQPIDQSPEDRGLLNDMWGRGIDNKPELVGIEPALAPDGDDLVLDKWRYSAFQKSSFEQIMKDWGKDQLLICGVYGHIGCMMTAANAFMLNIKPFLVGDAIADFSLEEHHMALRYTATRLGRVVSVQELAGR